MDFKAIGLLELASVAKGIDCADAMVKAANVDLILARAVCPGRYMAMIAGDTGAVQNAVEVGRARAGEFLVDSFVIPNVHPDVFPALSCATPITRLRALGIIETYSVASCISAADAAAKAAAVELIEIRCATGLAGKSFVTLTGDVGSVNASVDAGVGAVADTGLVMSHVVIPAPSPELLGSLT
ncbi:MAG: BMC domain-containing protein [Thermodesulfobacteriota bacterium]